jgi:hypothetical protein
MQNRKSIRAEHKKACEEIAVLEEKGRKAGCDGGPLPEDMNQYHALHAIKKTLEWVHISLIKTTAKPTEPNYLNELQNKGHRFYDLGPVGATLTWRRWPREGER